MSKDTGRKVDYLHELCRAEITIQRTERRGKSVATIGFRQGGDLLESVIGGTRNYSASNRLIKVSPVHYVSWTYVDPDKPNGINLYCHTLDTLDLTNGRLDTESGQRYGLSEHEAKRGGVIVLAVCKSRAIPTWYPQGRDDS